MVRSILLCLLACALSKQAAAAGPTTVAVMPFKDLSGEGGAVGEAIRETVTTDLKQLSGVRVIERGSLDKILAEQHLQGQRADLDPATAARVGKLLGATLIVAGAYQKALPQVRLTARFVQVETSEIIGTAKVDGRAQDFLQLQDRITEELLRSAGLAGPAQKVKGRRRAALKSLQTLELYGQAVLAENDDSRQTLLRQAIAEDSGFSYAVNDLKALEARIRAYQSQANLAQDREVREARAKLKSETDPNKAFALVMQIISYLMQQRRYRGLISEARTLLAGPLPVPTTPATALPPLLLFYIIMGQHLLGERDEVLRDGERYLARYPTSSYFSSVKMYMEQTIERKRRIEEGRATAAKAAAELGTRQRWNLCAVARVYDRSLQYTEARRLLRACLLVGKEPRAQTLTAIVDTDIELADWAQARKDLEALAREDENAARELRRRADQQIPADG